MWKAQELSNKECARRLGRHSSTIGRELTRNSFKGEHYVAIYAQAKADRRENRVARSKPQLKNPDIFTFVTEHLGMGWSPDQIASRLDYEHPGDDHWHVTAETIYRWIYQPKQMKGKHPWYEYLRQKKTRRTKYHGRKTHSSRISDRVSISKRGSLANLGLEFGNWEGNTIEGLSHRNGIHTEVERYYFPKGTGFTLVSEEELQDVVEKINSRPRKILGYKTANERFTELLMGIAIDY